MLEATEIPQDQTYQLTMSANEMSIFSLALTYLVTAIRGGTRASDEALVEGLAMFLSAGAPPQVIIRAMNDLMLKLDTLHRHFEENPPNETPC